KYFRVYYQKEVRALTGKVCGFEALARWKDPVMGIISPLVFVEVLESVHLVHKLDICIIDMVCSDLRDDIDSGCCVEPVSVNLSQLDFELCDILSEINKCREKYGIPTELLHIEVTESAIASGSDFLGEQIKKFRDAGYEVWMDDFGSGYSSFNNLKNYDFDVLKIDMDFLRSFETNKKSKVILATIVNMAKELGIHTLAEGVETQEQYEFLKRIGCEKLQGYLFGKPVPTNEIDRSKDLIPEFCEDIRFRKYYDSIGEVNLLGNTPLRPKTMEVVNNIPISFVEFENGQSRYLYANSAYMSFLSSVGHSSLKSADDVARNVSLQEIKRFHSALKKAEESEDKRSAVDTITNGSIINNKIRFLSSAEGRSAFAVVSRNISLHEHDDTTESLHVAMAHVFNQYFRVDLFDEDGTVVNIFLNSEQISVAEKSTDSVEACRVYADMYLLPQERKRFMEFYYMPTVLDRCKAQKADYLVDYYHSALPADKGRMQMYLILPFFYDNRWKYISCCRYADEIFDDGWKANPVWN
nr:EAL domain-containing protein [Butyrivibrio sp.]